MNTPRILRQISILCAAISGAGAGAHAQVALAGQMPGRGIVPAGTYAVSDIETVNVANGNLYYQIPMASLPPGRAGWSAGVNLVYNSQIWDLAFLGDGTQRLIPSQWGGWEYGFTYSINAEVRDTSYTTGDTPAQFCGDGTQPWKYMRLSVITPDQSHHTLYVYPSTPGLNGQTESFTPSGGSTVTGYADVNGEGYYDAIPGNASSGCSGVPFAAGNVTYFTNDGSYIKVVFDNSAPVTNGYWTSVPWTIYLPDGRTVTGISQSANAMMDRNGNKVTVTNTIDLTSLGNPVLASTLLQDDLNRTISIQYDTTGTGTDTITQTGADGSTLTWNVQRTLVSPSTSRTYICGDSGNASDTCVFTSSSSGNTPVTSPSDPAVSSISLPTGQTFTFGYDTASGWGEVNSMTLPSGASVAYHYSESGANKTNYSDILDNPVATKTLTWTDEDANVVRIEASSYCTIAAVPGNCAPVSTVTNPDGGVVSYLFSGLTSATYNQLVAKVTQPDGSTEEKIWAQNPPYALSGLPNLYYPGNPFVQYEIHSVASGGTPVLASVQTVVAVDRNGNPTTIGESDWIPYANITHSTVFSIPGVPHGFSSTPNLVRTTTSTYRFPTTTTASLSTDDANGYFHPSSNTAWGFPVSKVISGTGAGSSAAFTYGDTSGHPNLVQEQHLDSQTNTQLTTSYTYDQYGNPLTVTNPRGYLTAYTYGADQACPATKIVASGQAQQRTFAYSCNSWDLKVTAEDVDHQITRNFTYDAYGRTTMVTESGGGLMRSAATKYCDTALTTAPCNTARKVVVKSDLNSYGDGALQQTTYYDQLGRVREAVDPAGNIVQTSYYTGSAGDFVLTSNPFVTQTESTMGWTLTSMDRNGRPISTAHYSGSGLPAPWGSNSATGTATLAYDANTTVDAATVLATDEAGISRTSFVDGLGRMKQVVESGMGLATTYAWDSLDDLTQVTHPTGQTRTFGYSSMGRLLSATNPETGGNTVSYLYDANGNLTSRVLGGVTTTYAYDALDEMISRSYNDSNPGTPAVSYGYAAGWRTLVTTGPSSSPLAVSQYGYDGLGRVSSSSQTANSATYAFPNYAWNLADELTSETYPSGRVVTTTYDSTGRISGVAGSLSGTNTTYATGFSYATHGAPTQWTGGDSVVRAYGYNARLEMNSVAATGSSGQLLGLTLGYAGADNGNVVSESIARPGLSVSRSYGYDGVNRLSTASEGSNWSQTYVYDAVGNQALYAGSSVIASNLTPQTGSTTSVPFNQYNQWLSGTYDPSTGHLTGVGTQSFAYDAEQRLIGQTDSGTPSSTVAYEYDGDGNRILQTANGVTTGYVYDAPGNLAMQYSAAAPVVTGTQYLTTDHLGSTRLTTSGSGVVIACHDYLPFGQAVPQAWGRGTVGCYGQMADTTIGFTGQEQDAATGLDHFPARYLNPAQARFMTPDPLGNFVADPGNPQSWNMYSYVRNNPLAFVDPTGLCSQAIGGYSDADGDDSSFLFSGPCSAGQIGGTATGANSVTVSAQQGSLLDYAWAWATIYAGGSGGDQSGGNPVFTATGTATAPSNGQVPVHGPWHYGNYCGAGGMGTPINAIDAACQHHDQQFGNTKADWTNMQSVANWNKLSQQQQIGVQQANQDLCNAMASIYPTIPSWNLSQSVAALEIYWYFALAVPQGAQCHP